MASVSSLLKSAQATQKKIRAQEDALIAFEWENSAQTYEDFVDYEKYLRDRQETASDPSDQLSYATKQRSARRSFTSNELQRQQMAIMEGRASTQDKLNSIQNLYEQAVENGDFNLAQNLYSQWDALTIKLQNEQEAAARSYAASSSKQKNQFLNDLEKGFDNVVLPTGQEVTPLAAIQRKFAESGDSIAAMKAAEETMDVIKLAIIEQYENPSATQEDIDALEKKYGPGLADLDEAVSLKVGDTKLTSQDVASAIVNDELNNPLFGLRSVRNKNTGETEYQLTKNEVERIDYARVTEQVAAELERQGKQIYQIGEDLYSAVDVTSDQGTQYFGSSDQARGVNAQITDQGEIVGSDGQLRANEGMLVNSQGKVGKDSSLSIGNRLKALGVDVAKEDGQNLSVILPGENVERDAIVQPDGSIRYFGDDGQLYEMGVIRRNLGTDELPAIVEAGQARAVAPDEISDFGAESAFGGRLSQTSAQGNRYIESITGQNRVNGMLPGQSPINVGNDFRGFGSPAMGSNLQGTSSLLQSAASQRQTIQQEQQRQAMLQQQAQMQIQATNNQFNLNQTPVQQLASNGVLRKQLQVAKPTPQPRVVVAAPAPQQTIVGTSVARPTQNISGVGNYSRNYNVSVR